jgi:hypothetical protein
VAEKSLVEDAADELYGLPPGEFTSARDDRAKALRADGEREAAREVKALRRPTVAAWALNQLSRQRKKDLDALLAAGDDLRAAQEDLLGGGDRSAFQEAAATERDLVARLSADAASLASEAGERAGGLQEKVSETLHAAALDEDTAEELRAGRLVKEREAIGGFGAFDVAAPDAGGGARSKTPSGQTSSEKTSSAKRAGGAGSGKPSSSARAGSASSGKTSSSTRAGSASSGKASSSTRAGGASSGKASSVKRDADDARRRQRLAAARTDERHARRELESAERALQHARERADAAAANAKEAAERASKTAERVKEAARGQAAARKAHSRAQRALEKADTGPS